MQVETGRAPPAMELIAKDRVLYAPPVAGHQLSRIAEKQPARTRLDRPLSEPRATRIAVIVVAEFEAEESGDLGLRLGDRVTVTDKTAPSGWWVGYRWDDPERMKFP